MSALRPGDRIADRYRVETVLARGGMGAVYLATDERLERAVAVKVLLSDLADDEVAVARFQREARATAQLNHPGIVSVLDFGTTPEGLAYLVMEHVVGTTIAAVLDLGRLEPARAADIVEQALGALGVAHAAGIVHRDLKPGNLMLVPVGEGGREIVKVLDFGVAQLKDGAAYTRLTQTGLFVGTPSFMSPEQARGEPCDARTDVYAMGMVLWCCVTGTKPFKGSDVAELVHAVQSEVPPRADRVAPHVPAALATIAAKALEKSPDARYSSTSEMASALVAARSAPRQAASTPPAAAPSGAPIPITTSGAVALPSLPAAQEPVLWPRILGCAALLALAGLGVLVGAAALWFVYFRPSPSPAPSAPPSLPSLAPATPALVPSPDVELQEGEDPTFGEPLCARAIDCCHVYTERVEPMMPACEQVVGFSHGDITSCQRQLDMWRDRARERGTTLFECD